MIFLLFKSHILERISHGHLWFERVHNAISTQEMHHVPPAKRVYWAVLALSRCDRRQMFWRRWALRCWESQLKCWGINMDHHGSTVIRFPKMGGSPKMIGWFHGKSQITYLKWMKTRVPPHFRKSPYEAPTPLSCSTLFNWRVKWWLI